MKVAEQKLVITQTAKRRQWDQQPQETDKAWEAFQIWREMGQGHRSLTKLAIMLGKNPLSPRRWRIKYNWDLRCAAYDSMLGDHMEKSRIEEAKLMGARQAKLGMGMAEIAQKRVTQIVESDDLIASLNVADVARLAKDGTQIEREARGEDKNTGQTANITFNFNMAAPPKWAPQKVVDGALANITRAIVEGKQIPVPNPDGAAAAVDIAGDDEDES